MGSVFIKFSQDKSNAVLAGVLYPRIETILSTRGLGHCVRVADFDDEVMESVRRELRRIWPGGNIFILGSHDQEGIPFWVASTELVELCNPDANGELRQSLLMLTLASLRTSAKDSFGVAIFEELAFIDIYEDLTESLFDRFPVTLADYIHDLSGILTGKEWLLANDVSRVWYLLIVLENGIDDEAPGTSLYESVLIPGFKLFIEPGMATGKIRRNLVSVHSLVASHKSVHGRVADPGLNDKVLKLRLFTYSEEHDVYELEPWTPPTAADKSWWSISFNKRTFKGELSLDKTPLTVSGTDLPVIMNDETDDQLISLIGQQVLVPNNRRRTNVVFEADPHPGKVSGLDHFAVQVIPQSDGLVGRSKKVEVWTPNHLQCATSLVRLDKIEFEGGWRFARVTLRTADGDPIPLEVDFIPEGTKHFYESGPFYVLLGGNIEEESPQQAIPIEQSLEYTRLRLQLTASRDKRDPSDIAISNVV